MDRCSRGYLRSTVWLLLVAVGTPPIDLWLRLQFEGVPLEAVVHPPWVHICVGLSECGTT